MCLQEEPGTAQGGYSPLHSRPLAYLVDWLSHNASPDDVRFQTTTSLPVSAALQAMTRAFTRFDALTSSTARVEVGRCTEAWPSWLKAHMLSNS